jgi:hypothetical protein
MTAIKDFLSKVWEFIHALFFTRDDDLDILQVLFAAIIITALAATWRTISIVDMGETVQVEALITLRWLAGLLVITAVPKWLVPTISSIVEKKLPSDEKDESTEDYEMRPSSRRWGKD